MIAMQSTNRARNINNTPRNTNSREFIERAKLLANAIETTNEAWIVSIIGADKHLRLEILADSVLPDVLAEQGYKLTRGHDSTRIVSNAINAEVRDGSGKVILHTFSAGEVPITVWYLTLPE
jgi:hypothetical protein